MRGRAVGIVVALAIGLSLMWGLADSSATDAIPPVVQTPTDAQAPALVPVPAPPAAATCEEPAAATSEPFLGCEAPGPPQPL